MINSLELVRGSTQRYSARPSHCQHQRRPQQLGDHSCYRLGKCYALTNQRHCYWPFRQQRRHGYGLGQHCRHCWQRRFRRPWPGCRSPRLIRSSLNDVLLAFRAEPFRPVRCSLLLVLLRPTCVTFFSFPCTNHTFPFHSPTPLMLVILALSIRFHLVRAHESCLPELTDATSSKDTVELRNCSISRKRRKAK